jgi:uncharacterized protein (DUF983 family)
LRLRCPVCGGAPIFAPAAIGSLRQWFTPLGRCAACGCRYEREPGYFLMAVWALDYGFAVVFGLALWVILETYLSLPLPALLLAVLAPTALAAFALARHAKALWIAFDRFFDPEAPPSVGASLTRARGPRP